MRANPPSLPNFFLLQYFAPAKMNYLFLLTLLIVVCCSGDLCEFLHIILLSSKTCFQILPNRKFCLALLGPPLGQSLSPIISLDPKSPLVSTYGKMDYVGCLLDDQDTASHALWVFNL
jgi:hypothetical protein